jgi:hypothetical protein
VKSPVFKPQYSQKKEEEQEEEGRETVLSSPLFSA